MGAHQDRLKTLRLFLTVEHTCSYLPRRRACNLVADPLAMDNELYTQLARLGFRRSGEHVYRPHCAGCHECLSLRIPVAGFRPNRSQRRVWSRNADLEVRPLKPQFDLEHYRLYERYLHARHPGGGMDDCSPESYLSFLTSRWSDTRLFEFRHKDRLLAVAVADQLDDSLSAVYTFYEPDESSRSLGTYGVLWQVAKARRLGLAWVYLGYWVRDCAKMAYKDKFRPAEVFLGGRWLELGADGRVGIQGP